MYQIWLTRRYSYRFCFLSVWHFLGCPNIWPGSSRVPYRNCIALLAHRLLPLRLPSILLTSVLSDHLPDYFLLYIIFKLLHRLSSQNLSIRLLYFGLFAKFMNGNENNNTGMGSILKITLSHRNNSSSSILLLSLRTSSSWLDLLGG